MLTERTARRGGEARRSDDQSVEVGRWQADKGGGGDGQVITSSLSLLATHLGLRIGYHTPTLSTYIHSDFSP